LDSMIKRSKSTMKRMTNKRKKTKGNFHAKP
jgi:hypothetical protein